VKQAPEGEKAQPASVSFELVVPAFDIWIKTPPNDVENQSLSTHYPLPVGFIRPPKSTSARKYTSLMIILKANHSCKLYISHRQYAP
jgi:hypothetical protein